MIGIATSVRADERGDFDAFARRALAAAEKFSPASDGGGAPDLVELRLDRHPDVGEDALARLIARLARPVIVAAHGPDALGEHGAFVGDENARAELAHRAARAGAAFVDVDWRLAPRLEPLPASTRRIVSRHERGSRASARELLAELRAAARPGELVKLVVEAEDSDRALEVLGVLAGRDDTIAFASGEAGRFTRVLAPLLGSPISYAAPEPLAGEGPRPTASGQTTARALRDAWPANGPAPTTSIFAVVGRPIGQSISPRVHTRALRAAGEDAVFVALESSGLARTLALVHALHSAERWRGFAVTAPLKTQAFELATERDAASLRARACNTLVRASRPADASHTGNAFWSGHNTDVDGVEGALRPEIHRLGLARPARALVIGAGGAARAALIALEQLAREHGSIVPSLASRDDARARSLAEEFGVRALAWSTRNDGGAFDLVIQCTPANDATLLDARAIAPGGAVLDAVYRPMRTALLAAAERVGAHAIPGARWFARQAERQFELFTGRPPPAGCIEEEVRRALE